MVAVEQEHRLSSRSSCNQNQTKSHTFSKAAQPKAKGLRTRINDVYNEGEHTLNIKKNAENLLQCLMNEVPLVMGTCWLSKTTI
jgi:hypothetical protein